MHKMSMPEFYDADAAVLLVLSAVPKHPDGDNRIGEYNSNVLMKTRRDDAIEIVRVIYQTYHCSDQKNDLEVFQVRIGGGDEDEDIQALRTMEC